MFDGLMSPFHWMVILIVVLIVLGPKEGAKAARSVGRALEEVRRLGREPIDELLAHVSGTESDDKETPTAPTEGRNDDSARRDPRT